jgi:1-acyl-sn-glycerol-3-phosphate acyltransferase
MAGRSYLVHAVALQHGMLGACRYFAKAELVWTLPIFGLALYLVDMILVSRDWTRDAGSIRAAFASIKRHGQPIWLISYLEGRPLVDTDTCTSLRSRQAIA